MAASGEPRRQYWAAINRGEFWLGQGDLDAAQANFEAGLALAELEARLAGQMAAAPLPAL